MYVCMCVCVTLWRGLKVTGIEKEVPGLMTIVWGIKVVKNWDIGGLEGRDIKYM